MLRAIDLARANGLSVQFFLEFFSHSQLERYVYVRQAHMH